MKRICIVRHDYYPQEAHVRRNAEALLNYGYEVDIICLKKKKQLGWEVVHGINVYRLPVEHHRKGIPRYLFEYAAFFLLASCKLFWLYLTRKYSVIEVDNLPDFLVFTTILPKLLGARVIFYVFDNMPEIYMDGYNIDSGHILIRLLHFIEKVSATWADWVIVTQSTSKELLQRRGVRGSKISVVLNVPDEDVFLSCVPTGTNGSSFRLITHGTLVKRYNVQTLIKAIPLLTPEIPDLEVKVVGDGEDRQRLEELARSFGVNDHVHFTGWLPFDEISTHISQAHIGIAVIPAGANPSVPNKLLEYLAIGKPAIVTAIPSIRAYFDDGSVLYYEYDNEHDLTRCVLELYRSPEKRTALAAAGSAAYQRYRWSVMKFEYLNVFKSLIKDN